MTRRTSHILRRVPFIVAASYGVALGLFSFTSPAKELTIQVGGEGFDTPDEAAQALIGAASQYNLPALLEILGPGGKDLVASSDRVADKTRSVAFAALARQKTSVTVDPKDPRRAELSVGDDDSPFPIPLVEVNGKWYFDVKAGRREILLRRIGENELDAITILRGFVDAEDDYAFRTRNSDDFTHYTKSIIGTPGKQNGIDWQTADGKWEGPIGETLAKALQEGKPFHGYYFKLLKGQGPAAPEGATNFVVEGAMIGGFALVAAPAQYRVTGVKTFIVNEDGIVYQKDLGPNTLQIFRQMETYNPDKSWRPTKDAR